MRRPRGGEGEGGRGGEGGGVAVSGKSASRQWHKDAALRSLKFEKQFASQSWALNAAISKADSDRLSRFCPSQTICGIWAKRDTEVDEGKKF